MNDNTASSIYKRAVTSIKPFLVPLLILYCLNKEGQASSLELRKFLEDFSGEKIDYEPNSYYRLIAQLEARDGLIEPVGVKKQRGPARVYYSLTPLGNEVLKIVLKKIIEPLQKLETNKPASHSK